jgi:hypothetical protein
MSNDKAGSDPLGHEFGSNEPGGERENMPYSENDSYEALNGLMVAGDGSTPYYRAKNVTNDLTEDH